MKHWSAIFFVALFSTAALGEWQYETTADDMSGKIERKAGVRSANTVDLGFPYKVVGAWITIRQHPRHGRDVIFSLDRGQMMCRAHNPCDVLVRFDDAPPLTFKGSPPADHSSDAAFLDGVDSFIAKARKAKRIRVSTSLYQRGSPVFEFQVVTPLVWK